MRISGRRIGPGYPVFVIAEMSGNHNQDFDEAVRIIQAAKGAGADAIKLQTYTADTLTIDSDSEYFRIKGTLWEGQTLYSLYKKAYTPWEWHPKLKEAAQEAGIILFSTPFDKTAVDYLEKMEVPAYKIASFELVDIPLIEYAASKGKPMIMSTGMATLDEIKEAVDAARGAGAKDIALLKCTSAYPAPPEEMNLRTIADLSERFGVVSGLSDHSMGIAVPAASVALGASIIEKHLTLSRAKGGPDSAFSLEPSEFAAMVETVRVAEKAVGAVHYGLTEKEEKSKVFRRSLFVVKDVKAGDIFTEDNVRSIRPGHGLKPKHIKDVLGKKASKDIKKGTPLDQSMLR
ncbi:MAG: pseudaminic acid synthase [Thermodesulfovibrionales bacterium]|nr:pseudaminic acid synthase [Thermodesulfovibrionales bacterium]